MSTEESSDQPQAQEEVGDTNNGTTASTREIERQEEEKLKAKYPNALGMGGPRGPGAHSSFLQKRLQKGQKYFDSGDYQMAKQKGGGIKQVFANKTVTTGDAIPTPESVPVRKTSIIQPTCNKFTTS
uniref:CSON007766 protein n=1 Tax=Culicoides sonorensis TaxID=179676 RepID=A0A336KGY7_CULSO